MFCYRQYLFLASSTALCDAQILWSSSPVTNYSDIIKEAMPFGPPGAEKVVLNIDSLWSGGPFGADNCTGGNASEEMSSCLSGIRGWIFSGYNRKCLSVLGNYKRTLDLETGIYTTQFSINNGDRYITQTYCSGPDQVCIYELSSTTMLPVISLKLKNQLGVNQVRPPEGMKYEGVVKVTGIGNYSTHCSKTNSAGIGTLLVPSIFGVHSISIVETCRQITTAAASISSAELEQRHIKDYELLSGAFTLELQDLNGSAAMETSKIFSQYNYSQGAPFVESLLFDYSRHLSHFAAEQTWLGDIQDGLWRYMQDTWVLRGTKTAKLLYGAPGWVTYDKMNIFGHTVVKGTAQWAYYPISAAWMMQHVHDTGYPLLKGEDHCWNDDTLVVNPCDSPEHGPTTFECTHYQQLLHKLFTNVTILDPLASKPDSSFRNNLSNPEETETYDIQNDPHRHLSHLWSWYLSLSIISSSPQYFSGYTNQTIQTAIANSLHSRRFGNGPDANSGWEKRAYFELKYAIKLNFVGNALSMYSERDMPFQIDANFGFAGAVLSMLVVNVEEREEKTVVLGSVISREWGRGSVSGLRLRGGLYPGQIAC
ncbi:uncharacterized protein BDR25DRAFT_331090 [Lindgomyces ingoldianus]|uniref:Uncharacterized protein n=1 Tax=Lindgomyces ingoldianus TaxID=673940 RepID=A0ACB6RDB0_9PLEO|nr:uncharacterized protein BDR25DRAFT_331090 [Lindgomyces ingoldianus]KAF2477319.1 hypothetical protein BDR25DRAFT_331090 [Lindgomyces ingoldianus]